MLPSPGLAIDAAAPLLDLEPFRRDGFQVLRAVVERDDVERWRAESERLRRLAREGQLDEGRVRVLRQRAADGERLRGLQHAHRINAIVDGIRLDPRLARIQIALLGRTFATAVSTLFWKSPGDAATGIAWHRDTRFRTPSDEAPGRLTTSLHLAVALDPQSPDNGGLRFVRGSHLGAQIPAPASGSVLDGDGSYAELATICGGSHPAASVCDLVLAPGDVVIWGSFTLHGSPPNRSRDRERHSVTLVSVSGEAAGSGDPAFVDGRPIPAV